jgi:hypothetical protein
MDQQQIVVVRVMVLADSAEDAAPAAEFVRKTIEPYGRITRHEIERYWKVPELQEIYFLLELTCGACDARWPTSNTSRPAAWRMMRTPLNADVKRRFHAAAKKAATILPPQRPSPSRY